MENNQQSFWQFSDQLRLQSNNLANLSINDSIWGNSFTTTKRPEERRNFDIRVGGDRSVVSSNDDLKVNGSDFNGYGWKMGRGSDFNSFNDSWKVGSGLDGVLKNVGVNGVFDKGIYPKPIYNNNNYNNNNNGRFNINPNSSSGSKGKGISNSGKKDEETTKGGKKNKNNDNSSSGNNSKNSTDKKFKTLPPSESLPRNETIGGYIFVCNNDTMQENLQRLLFGLPPRYRDSVRTITPGLPLFLYNYTTHQMHGIFEAASFGGTNIDPTAWEDKKCPGESRFPAQVRVITRKMCDPLEEDAFRPILHHYDGPKFRLELSVPEAIGLLDIFAEKNP